MTSIFFRIERLPKNRRDTKVYNIDDKNTAFENHAFQRKQYREAYHPGGTLYDVSLRRDNEETKTQVNQPYATLATTATSQERRANNGCTRPTARAVALTTIRWGITPGKPRKRM